MRIYLLLGFKQLQLSTTNLLIVLVGGEIASGFLVEADVNSAFDEINCDILDAGSINFVAEGSGGHERNTGDTKPLPFPR